MRRVVLVLMILLLPLRGWLGDAMAMDAVAAPAAHAVAMTAAVDADPMAHAGQGTPPCHEAVQTPMAGQHGTGHADPDGGTGHKHCTACQICHSVAAADVGMASGPAAPPHAAPRAGTPRFASAELRLAAKPPIS